MQATTKTKDEIKKDGRYIDLISQEVFSAVYLCSIRQKKPNGLALTCKAEIFFFQNMKAFIC